MTAWERQIKMRCSYQRRGSSRRRVPRGFTLIETMVVITIASVLAVVVSSLVVTTFSVWQSEMRQNELNWRERQFMTAITLDTQRATALVNVGSAAYTCPAGNAPYNLPSGFATATIPAGTKLIVFQTPSYNASGIVNGKFDYIGYGWTGPGTIVRTCIPSTSSQLAASTKTIAGLDGDTWNLKYRFHVASGSADATYANTWQDLFATPSIISTILADGVDQVFLDATVSVTILNQTPTQELQSTFRLRNATLP